MTRRRFSVSPVAFCVLGLTVLPLGTVSEAYSQTTGYPSRSPIVAAVDRINPWGAIAEIVKTTLLGVPHRLPRPRIRRSDQAVTRRVQQSLIMLRVFWGGAVFIDSAPGEQTNPMRRSGRLHNGDRDGWH